MVALETRRLVVRSFRPEDWPALRRLILQYQGSELAAYDHPWPTSEEKLKEVTVRFAANDGFMAVCLRDTGEFLGLLTFHPVGPDEADGNGLGFIFDSRYHGRGYATEACGALLADAFAANGVGRVVSATAGANRPAIRLLERLGFTKTGEAEGSFRTDPEGKPIVFTGFTYALSRDEWTSRVPAPEDRLSAYADPGRPGGSNPESWR
jgi:[ribosomal protein S5]-alanine N-acetyltransferase